LIECTPPVWSGLLVWVVLAVDGVTFNAHILDTGTPSYRLRTSKTSAGSDRQRWQTEWVPAQERIRPAGRDGAAGVWPLARDFATSFTRSAQRAAR
jgi:hypothetical protein